MSTWNKCTSAGGIVLSEHLRESINDYWHAFGKAPKLIVIPEFRRVEFRREFATLMFKCSPHQLKLANANDGEFRGIPFRFSMISDSIELS